MRRKSATTGQRAGFFLWARDWLASTSALSMSRAARSMYLDMLCHQSLGGDLPDDPKVLARILGETPEDFLAAWEGENLRLRFESVGGMLSNRRLAEEMAADSAYREAKSKAGTKSAEQRKFNRRSTQPPTDGQQTSNESGTKVQPPSPSPFSSDSPPTPSPGEQPPETKRKRKARDNGPMPEWPPAFQVPEFQEAWADWLKARSEKGRGGYAPTGLRTLIRQTEALGLPVAEIAARLRRSTAEGWAGPHLDVPINRSQSANGSRPAPTTPKPAYIPF